MSKFNVFNTVVSPKPKYSSFDLSHDHKLTLNMGNLVPIFTAEVLPGDRFNIKSEAMLRLQPLLAPIMHKVDVYQHFFFVPNRIIWDGWESFITGNNGQPDPPTPPLMATSGTAFNVQISSLADYLGLPNGSLNTDISALPFAAYQKIWFDYYADENVYDMNAIQDYFWLDDGLQNSTKRTILSTIRKRAWEHDYFTASLPWAQKGADVNIPLQIGGTADVYLQNDGTSQSEWVKSNTGLPPDAGGLDVDASGVTRDVGLNALMYNPDGSLKVDAADFQNVNGTINDLRTALALQKWLEKNARGGTRYIESLLAHFGVRSSDKRLQRAEYLGGVKAPMVISEVLQLSESGETPQGTMAGHGISVGSGRPINYRAEEHGFIIGIMSILPRTAYQQGIPRQWTKFDFMDYAWPDFAFLGEQAVLSKELYYNAADGDENEEVFGYIPRYSEYRYLPSRVSGDMRDSLAFWHMGRIFSNRPQMNIEFIDSNPTTRIFAVEDSPNDNVIAHVFFKIFATRPLPKYGTPGGLM